MFEIIIGEIGVGELDGTVRRVFEVNRVCDGKHESATGATIAEAIAKLPPLHVQTEFRLPGTITQQGDRYFATVSIGGAEFVGSGTTPAEAIAALRKSFK